MLDWIKNLEPEFLIIFGGLFVALIINVVILLKSGKTLNLIGKRALYLNEDFVIRSDRKVIDILVSNTSFISVKVAAVGYIFKKNLLPISEEVTEIAPRDSKKISIEIDALRAYVINENKKVTKLKIYAEDSLGRRTIYRAKDSYRTLKKIIKAENTAIKKEAKRKRFETGNYNFWERVGLVFKFIFSPFSKLNRAIKKGLNKKLKVREAKLKMKRKEDDHKTFLKSIAEDDRREKELLDLENKIALERKEIEKQQQEKHRLNELKKQQLLNEMAKIEKQKLEQKAHDEAEEKREKEAEEIQEKAKKEAGEIQEKVKKEVEIPSQIIEEKQDKDVIIDVKTDDNTSKKDENTVVKPPLKKKKTEQK